MDFNPISIDEDGHTQRQNGVAGPHTATNAAAAAAHAGAVQSSRSASTLLTPSSTFGDALRLCRNAFYYHMSWSMPYPEVPASPMLYFPEEYRRMVASPEPLGVMQSELDAMQMGVLDSIPLAYYQLDPSVVDEVRAAMRRSLLRKKRAEAAAAAGEDVGGSANAAATRPPQQGRLAPADAEIARIVVDANEIQIRNLPSLTHVQRPLYTDIGLVPQEDRHAARVARTQPKEIKPAATAVTTADMLRQWRLDVQASFVEAGELDTGFASFMAEVAHTKLGLDRENPDHLRLTRALWSRLYHGTTREQQQKVWYALCRFSSTFSEARAVEAAVAQLHLDRPSLRLVDYDTRWRPLLTQYVEAVGEYVASLAGGVEERREHLQFHDKELDQLYTGNVFTNIELAGKLARMSDDRLKNAIYPVEVMPVFPSGYQQAAGMGPAVLNLRESEELDFLAERDASVHHVVLPDAVVHKSALGRPHMLVGDCNLLVAEEGGFSSVQPGSTVRYSVSKKNAYQSLQKDNLNTASYLLRMGQVDVEAAQPLGTNYDGRYMTYDRIGYRDIYQKTNNADSSTLSRYVVMFADAPAAPSSSSNSNSRDGNTGAAAVGAGSDAFVGVKRERGEDGTTEPVSQAPRTE